MKDSEEKVDKVNRESRKEHEQMKTNLSTWRLTLGDKRIYSKSNRKNITG
jgi:hypothetical protein